MNSTDLYCDVETKSGDRSRGATKPHLGDKIVGVALTADDNPNAYYLPVRHAQAGGLFSGDHTNLDPATVTKYLDRTIGSCENWVNHGIKFDIRFLDAAEGVASVFKPNLIDTLTMARVVDMQRGLGHYGLKELDVAWCGGDASDRDAVKGELAKIGSRDYGDVDCGIMGDYACGDVLKNRGLYHEIRRRRYDTIGKVWDMEVATTKALAKIERHGVRVDEEGLDNARMNAQAGMASLQDEAYRLGHRVDLDNSNDLVRYFTEGLRLPVVLRTKKTKEPSASKDAILLYQELDAVLTNPDLASFFGLIGRHSAHSQFVSLYCEGWSALMRDGMLFPDYKQTVNTGRMAAGGPNIQQLSALAKRLIIPPPGMGFLCRDYSQVEYRMIAMIAKSRKLIDAYKNDPSTDIHRLVATMCGVERSPAKTINFGIAFGMSDGGILRALRRTLGHADEAQGRAILAEYGRQLPDVVKAGKASQRVARERAHYTAGEYGWVKTLYGRKRALQYWPYEHPSGRDDDTRKAFNTAAQGGAADVMKDTLPNVVEDAESGRLAGWGVYPISVVHDEILFQGPLDVIQRPEVGAHIDALMCDVSIPMEVPMRTDGTFSVNNWKEAKGD